MKIFRFYQSAFKSLVCFFLGYHFLVTTVFAQPDSTRKKWGDWQSWGDKGNGTYLNPILPADFSDLDCIRVGSDYYAVSSTFQYSPGFVVLRSKDLVNWKIIGHVVNDLKSISPELNWDRMNRYGRGIWAGAIRYHNRKFYVYFGDPDMGYFMSTSTDAAGPWQPLHQVLAEKGWDDCCPFWDDDGQGYLVGTHFSNGYKVYLFKLSADGKEINQDSGKIIHQSRGSEANKMYKFNGTYYHFFSEVRAGGRAVMMERSANIFGPYNEVKQLSHPQKEANEPNQGGLLQTQKGDWYFLTHHGTGDWSGRVMSLLPVTWISGWPVIGKVGADTIGTMAWSAKMPLPSASNFSTIQHYPFSSKKLEPEWEWNYQPRDSNWSLQERKGWLRLHAFQPLEKANLLKAGNTLTQRCFRTRFNEIIIKIDISGMADGQHCGLSHFGSPNYSSIGVVCEGNARYLENMIRKNTMRGAALVGTDLWLKSSWGLDGFSHYSYSINGKDFLPFGEAYQMMWGAYRGDRLAIYCFNDQSAAGYLDVDEFTYRLSH